MLMRDLYLLPSKDKNKERPLTEEKKEQNCRRIYIQSKKPYFGGYMMLMDESDGYYAWRGIKLKRKVEL